MATFARPSEAVCPVCGAVALSAETNTQQIPVPTMGGMIPDQDWRFVDSHHHIHTHENSARMYQWVQDEENWFDLDGEEWNGEGHYECRHCGDLVEPGMKYHGGEIMQYVGGRTTIILRPCGHEVASLPS